MIVASTPAMLPRATVDDIAALAVDAAEGCSWNLATYLFEDAARRCTTMNDAARMLRLSRICADYAAEVRP